MSLRLVRSSGNVVKQRRQKAPPIEKLRTSIEILEIARKLHDLQADYPEAIVAFKALADSYFDPD